MLLREGVERAVPQLDDAVRFDGLVAALTHRSQQRLVLTGSRLREVRSRPSPDLATELMRGRYEGATHLIRCYGVDGAGQQSRG